VSFPFDLHSAALSDSHLSCRAHAIPDHAILLKATAQHVRRGTPCGLTASFRLLPAIMRSSTKVIIRRIPISDAGGQCETKHRLSWTRKIVVAARYKKTSCYTVGLAVRIFPATMWTFTKDTALSEQGRTRHGMCELRHGMAGERHAMCEPAFTVPPLHGCDCALRTWEFE